MQNAYAQAPQRVSVGSTPDAGTALKSASLPTDPAAGAFSMARFAAFEVDFVSRELRKHGLRLRIAKIPLRILELLLDRPGQVVTRNALREELWPNTHVSYEHSLNTAVNTLRGLLGDSAQNPRFVETLPRLGYRFVSPVVKTVASSNNARHRSCPNGSR